MSENNETKFDPVTGQNVAQAPQPENPYVAGQNGGGFFVLLYLIQAKIKRF